MSRISRRYRPTFREALLSYPGVFDVSDSFDSPRDELVLELKPAAETLGISLADVAQAGKAGVLWR